MTLFGKSISKQLLDQSAHCLAGIGLAALLSISISALQAIPFVAAFGFGREMIQHRSFSIGPGRAFDAAFFVAGALIWGAVLYFQ